MISETTFNKIHELHEQGYSGPSIARMLQCHKSTVYRVLNGNERFTPDSRPPFDETDRVRCPECGGLVHPPCLECSITCKSSERK